MVCKILETSWVCEAKRIGFDVYFNQKQGTETVQRYKNKISRQKFAQTFKIWLKTAK